MHISILKATFVRKSAHFTRVNTVTIVFNRLYQLIIDIKLAAIYTIYALQSELWNHITL